MTSPSFDAYLAAQVEDYVNPADEDADEQEQDCFDDEPDICDQFWSP